MLYCRYTHPPPLSSSLKTRTCSCQEAAADLLHDQNRCRICLERIKSVPDDWNSNLYALLYPPPLSSSMKTRTCSCQEAAADLLHDQNRCTKCLERIKSVPDDWNSNLYA